MKALPERCNLNFKGGKVAVTPYWDIDATNKFRGTFDDKKERFRELFRDSVRLHMRSDVEVGGMLSGGMDSPSIASVVGRDFPTVPFKTFTIYYEGRGQMDERAWAREVVSTYPNLEPIYYAPSDREIAECFDAASRAHELPIASSPAMSLYFVMKLAAERKTKVLLDGAGADTYLAGNWQEYDIRLIGTQIKSGRWLRALKSLQEVHQERSLDVVSTGLLGLKGIAAAAMSEEAIWRGRSLFQFARITTAKEIPADLPNYRGSPLSQYHYHRLFHTFLPGLLHCGDRVSMAFSIECRAPFLDHRLVEFAFALDDEDKIRGGLSKYILRQSMEGIVPQAILARRHKQPFVGQEVHWLGGPLKHLIEQPMNFGGIDIINEREARRVVLDFKQGDRSKTWLVWRLATLNYWVGSQ
jgi:asparagine synthase (glutamine-hydrolysing)